MSTTTTCRVGLHQMTVLLEGVGASLEEDESPETNQELVAKAEPPLKCRNVEPEIYHKLSWRYYVSLYDVLRTMSL